jgi:GNAT superfamily N-acetyltransferase
MMKTMNLEIRAAKLAEIDSAIQILLDATTWLEGVGEMRWNKHQFRLETLTPLAHSGELHLAFRDGQAVGTMYLQPEDQVFWSDMQKAESLFIHKLALSQQARGTGVATAMIEFAKLEVRRRERKYLRLDCRDHPKIRAIYENAGFKLRDIDMFIGSVFCRYELNLQQNT